jgi:hypothetical protein
MSADPEMIRQRIKDTQSALAAKLEILEHEVTQSVRATTTAVSDTLSTVKEKVNQTVTGVREAFDIGHQLGRHPWLFAAGALALGYVGARLAANNGREASKAGTAWFTQLAVGYGRELLPLAADVGVALVRQNLERALPPSWCKQVVGVLDKLE